MPYPAVLTFLFVLCMHIAQGQSKFENGYYIDNGDKRTECLIKNMDWVSNPEAFEYKSTTDAAIKKLTLIDVKEFGIYNRARYIRAEDLPLEISSDLYISPTDSMDFNFVEKTVFLRYEVESTVSLLSYEKQGKTNFFYLKQDGRPTPLLYKLYYGSPTELFKNEHYKQELTKELNCGSTIATITGLTYSLDSLTAYFLRYNSCAFGNTTATKIYQSQAEFNITVKGGGGFVTQNFIDMSHQFFVPQVGIEFEFGLPRRHKKFSILSDPNFSMALVESHTDDYHVRYKYRSFNIPLGGRYYYHVNTRHSFYVTATFGIRLLAGSQREYWNDEYHEENYLLPTFTLSGGVGYRLGRRIRTEIKYTSDVVRNASSFADAVPGHFRLQKIDIALGYTIN